MAITLTKITPTQHLSAVEWIEDSFVGNVTNLTPNRAYQVVQRHYDGGWDQFLTDLGDDSWM